MNLRHRRAIVTGASGFIGRAVVDALRRADIDVHGVARHRPPDSPPGITWSEVDLLDRVSTFAFVPDVGADLLVAGAWCAEPPGYRTSPDNARWVESTIGLVDAFLAAGGRRVVGLGTGAEYSPDGGLCDEFTTPLSPVDPYGVSKLAAGRAVLSRCEQVGVPACWLRLFGQYGPFEHPTRVVATVIRSLLAGRHVPCTDGSQRRDFLFVGDVGEAVVAVCRSSIEGPVNVGSGEPLPLREVLLEIGSSIGRPELLGFGELPRTAHEHDLFAPRTTRLSSEVGWSPSVTLSEGVRTSIAWWQARDG